MSPTVNPPHCNCRGNEGKGNGRQQQGGGAPVRVEDEEKVLCVSEMAGVGWSYSAVIDSLSTMRKEGHWWC